METEKGMSKATLEAIQLPVISEDALLPIP